MKRGGILTVYKKGKITYSVTRTDGAQHRRRKDVDEKAQRMGIVFRARMGVGTRVDDVFLFLFLHDGVGGCFADLRRRDDRVDTLRKAG